ncbi:hypothetical protein ACFMQL_20125 [Nonomuraea fastidiosa]
MAYVYQITEPCPRCGAAAYEDCLPDCELMHDPYEQYEDDGISDADPGL